MKRHQTSDIGHKTQTIGKKSCIILVSCLLSLVSCLATSAFAYSMIQPSRLMGHQTSIGGVQYYPLKKVADYHGLSLEWDALIQKVTLYKDGRYLSFIVGEPFYMVDRKVEVLKYPAKVRQGKILIPKTLALSLWWKREAKPRAFQASLSRLPFQLGQFKISKIVIDAGHGGKDQGARSYGIREKNVNLQIAKKIRNKLRANGVQVFMTRQTDRFVALQDRAKMANRSGADLFISIHANASPSRAPYGFEAYYLSEALDDRARAVQILENASLQYEENVVFPNKNSRDPTVWDLVLTENRKESAELAKIINRNVHSSRLTPSRGVKTARFHVLKWTDIPSILIETGFVTNYKEARKLANRSYQDKLATQITAGILEYKDVYERTNGFTR